MSRWVKLQTTSFGNTEKDPAGGDVTEVNSATPLPAVMCSLISREHEIITNKKSSGTAATTFKMGYPSVEEITKNFPQQSIPPIVGKLTYTSIRAVHHLLQENTTSVPTTLGGGHHGHLALVTNPARYLTISRGAAFNPPRNVGPVPIPPC
eukprot:13377545-Ditylum_brightwellii.AAC.1